MKNSKVVLILLLSLCAGFMVCAVGAGLVAAFLASQYQGPVTPVATVPILVAAMDLPAGTVITEPEKLFVYKPFLADRVPPGGFTNMKDVRGKVLARSVDRNSPVTIKDLSVANDLFKAAAPDWRAVTIRVTRECVPKGGFLPGTRVDVIGKEPGPDDPNKLVPMVVVENVMVLAVSTLRKDPNEEKVDPPATELLTLAVTMEQRLKLVEASKGGPFTVLLRKPTN